jgi:hypothetical protein
MPSSRVSSAGRSPNRRPATVPATLFFCAIFALAGVFWPAAVVAADADAAARVIAREFSAYWNEYDQRIGRAMRKWGCEELGSAQGATVFYPFSGPDLPTVMQLFPDADRYVLVSMQKAEAPPRLEGGPGRELDSYLAAFRKAWKFYGALGFFRTEDLEAVESAPGIRVGMTGPLMAFAARLGFRIESVEPIWLDPGGPDVVPRDGIRDTGDTWSSARLSLSKGERKVVVDYVSMDLQDAWLVQVPQARAWIERMAGNPTLIKAASHLPQERGFSILRNSLLENAPSIVQDETGIEYGELARTFPVRLYGKFTRTNPSFSGGLQQALAAAYRSGGVKPLPFRFGYEKNAGSALQVAVRGSAARSACRRPSPSA